MAVLNSGQVYKQVVPQSSSSHIKPSYCFCIFVLSLRRPQDRDNCNIASVSAAHVSNKNSSSEQSCCAGAKAADNDFTMTVLQEKFIDLTFHLQTNFASTL